MIYMYAIADRPEHPLPDQLGLRDEPLTKVIWGDVFAVISAFNGEHPSKDADQLWRHEEVVESLMSDRAVLPARFGTLLPSQKRVGDMLCRAYRTLIQDIDLVRGHVEIGMRFLSATGREAQTDTTELRRVESPGLCADGSDHSFTSSDRPMPPATGRGSAYLWARLASERETRDRQRANLRLVREAYELLASHANASKLDNAPDDRHGTSAAFLVPRECIESFGKVVGEVANAHPELALLCTGPWPPYSFVSAGEGATGRSNECHAG